MLRRFVVLSVVCSLLVFGVGARSEGAEDPDELKSQLEELHEDLDKHLDKIKKMDDRRRQYRQELDEVQEKETSILSLLEKYNLWVESSRERLKHQKRQKKQALKKLRRTSRKLNEVQAKLEQREQMLGARLRKIYKQGALAQTKMLLGSTSMVDLLTRRRYYREVLSYDRRILEDYRESRVELEKLRQQRQQHLKKRRRLTGEIQTTLKEQEMARRGRKKALEKLREQKASYQKRLDELEARQQELTNMVAKLRREKNVTQERIAAMRHKFGRSKGELPWPVESREILRAFGDWEEEGISRSNQGIDIAVEEGQEVGAVAPGRVVYARRFRGLGRVVILRHGGDYFTSYGSLVELKVETGADVGKGQQLGRAGHTSGGEEPRLYFQIIKGQDILDPMKWLK